MSLVKLSFNDFVKPIGLCSFVIIIIFTIYYFTKGSFFDGVLLTLLGISTTFLMLILSVLVFKLLSDLLVNKSYRILGVLVSFVLTLSFSASFGFFIFKIVSSDILGL